MKSLASAYHDDIQLVLEQRYANGGDHWATEDGGLAVERPNRRLAKLSAFAKGQGSVAATRRYHEIRRNMGRPAL